MCVCISISCSAACCISDWFWPFPLAFGDRKDCPKAICAGSSLTSKPPLLWLVLVWQAGVQSIQDVQSVVVWTDELRMLAHKSFGTTGSLPGSQTVLTTVEGCHVLDRTDQHDCNFLRESSRSITLSFNNVSMGLCPVRALNNLCRPHSPVAWIWSAVRCVLVVRAKAPLSLSSKCRIG